MSRRPATDQSWVEPNNSARNSGRARSRRLARSGKDWQSRIVESRKSKFPVTSSSILASICALFCLPFLLGAAPDSAYHNPTTDDLVWFIVVADSHVTVTFGGKPKHTKNMEWALTELVETVQPDFVVHAGDLVDATYGGLIPIGQFSEEWEIYHNVVESAQMDPSFYFDLPGNHDQYSDATLDHYMQWSLQGSFTGQANHAWVIERKNSKYLFVGLATCGSDGAPWPIDNAGLDDTDLAFMNSVLQQHQDADIVTFFGHHPAANLGEGREELYDALIEGGATAYVFGHIHEHTLSWQNGVLHVSPASIGKSKEKQILLMAYDGRGLSLRAFDVGEWPMVLTTAPLDAGLGGCHQHDYMVSASQGDAKIRALAFHPDGIENVEGVIDSEIIVPMALQAENVWEGVFDATQLDSYPHTLSVTAYAQGTLGTHTTTFYVFASPTDAAEAVVEQEEVDAIEQPESDATEETIEADAMEIVGPSSETEAIDAAQDFSTPPAESDAIGDLPFEFASGDGLTGWAETEDVVTPPGARGLIRARSDGCNASAQPASSVGFLVMFVSIVLSWLSFLNRRNSPHNKRSGTWTETLHWKRFG